MKRRYWITVDHMKAYNKTKNCEMVWTEVFMHIRDEIVNHDLEVNDKWAEFERDDWLTKLAGRRVIDEDKDIEIFYLGEDENVTEE